MTLVKINSCKGFIVSLKGLGILPDVTLRRFAFDPEDLKPHWKSEKRPYFSR